MTPTQLAARCEAAESRPAWFKCVIAPTDSGLFTEGVAYEVHSYENGRALLVTDRREMCLIPVEGHEFEPHDPWAQYHAALAAAALKARA